MTPNGPEFHTKKEPPSSGDTLADLAMRIRYDLTAAQAKLTELVRAMGDAGLTAVPRPNINGPVTAPTCPDCDCGGGLHTDECLSQRAKVLLAAREERG